MKHFNVLIIGLGSIGRRHIKILKALIDCSIFVLRQKNKTREDIPEVEKYLFDCKEINKIKIDFAIVCNPPIFHVETAIILAKKNIPFLMEKPVCVSMRKIPQLLDIVKDKGLPVLVGFNLRHHYLYNKIKELIASKKMGKILAILAETGQYLPNWREFDYTTSYSAYRDLGGGVIFDLTHEIDLAVDLLGEVNSLSCMKKKMSSLKIDSEDIAEITLSHKNGGICHLHLDYLQKEYTRKFKLIFENGEIFWDYSSGRLRLTSTNKRSNFSQPENYTRDNTFISQLKHWLEVLSGKQKPLVSLERGVYISKIALCAHSSSEKRKWINVK